MTDTLPAIPELPVEWENSTEAREYAETIMRGALVVLDEMLPSQAGNVDGLAAALKLEKQLAGDLAALKRRTEDLLVEAMSERVMTVWGVGTITRYGGDKSVWDIPMLLEDLFRLCFSSEEGELIITVASLRQFTDWIVRVFALDTKSVTVRTGALESIGLDPNAYREKTPGRKTVSLT